MSEPNAEYECIGAQWREFAQRWMKANDDPEEAAMLAAEALPETGVYAETVSANIHKGTPAKVFADDVESTCIHCHKGIRQVPGGHGPTWVHSDSGAVVGSGPAQMAVLEAVMLIGARQARRDGGAYWLGYLQALSDATGCAPSTLIAWLDSHEAAE